MSTKTKIQLRFETFQNPELEEKIANIGKLTRLFCLMKFRLKDGYSWSKTREVIVDTGAPISVIPLDFWLEADTRILAEHDVYGINPREECSIPMLVGNIKSILVDEEGNQSRENEFLAYLALTNKIPLILGFKDLLSNFSLCFEQETGSAFIEIKEDSRRGEKGE